MVRKTFEEKLRRIKRHEQEGPSDEGLREVLQGDAEPGIVGDCLNSLLAITPAGSLKFAQQLLESGEASLVEEAALAIGNSRLTSAFEVLCNFRECNVLPAIKRMLLLPIALTRCDEAFVLLLRVLQEEHRENAIAAIEALSVYGINPGSREQIRAAAYARGDRLILESYKIRFAQGAQ